MTKWKAIAEMNKGHKVTHKSFMEDEYIYMKGGMIHDENEYPLPTFWEYRKDGNWAVGWEIKK